MVTSGPPETHEGVVLEPWDRTYGATPPLTMTMAIDAPVYSVSTSFAGRPNLIFTITSQFSHPITIFTRNSPLDPDGAWNGCGVNQNFSATDPDTGRRVWFIGQEKCRGPIRCILGHPDERYYLTLYPKTPVKVSYPMACSGWNPRRARNITLTPRSWDFKGEVFDKYFRPGHKYRVELAYRRDRLTPFDVSKGRTEPNPDREEQVIFWWRYGTKEEVLAPRGSLKGMDRGWSEPRIRIGGVPGVELEIDGCECDLDNVDGAIGEDWLVTCKSCSAEI